MAAFEPSPFDTWIEQFDFESIPDADLTPAGDPDGDDANNLMEFALNGNPANPAPSGKLRSSIEEIADSQVLVLTLPVRDGAVYGGSPAKSAVVDGMTYLIEGTADLHHFDEGVTEIPASASGMPDLDSGWTYHSFRLDDTPAVEPRGFLRATIMAAP
jgi:hypothetical protein